MPLPFEDSPKGSRSYPLTKSYLTLWDLPVVTGVPPSQSFLLHHVKSVQAHTKISLKNISNICYDSLPSYCGPQTRTKISAPSVGKATSQGLLHWSESQVKKQGAWPTALWSNLERGNNRRRREMSGWRTLIKKGGEGKEGCEDRYISVCTSCGCVCVITCRGEVRGICWMAVLSKSSSQIILLFV